MEYSRINSNGDKAMGISSDSSPLEYEKHEWGFPSMGYPNSWMVYFMENPYKWMDDN